MITVDLSCTCLNPYPLQRPWLTTIPVLTNGGEGDVLWHVGGVHELLAVDDEWGGKDEKILTSATSVYTGITACSCLRLLAHNNML